MDYLKMDFGAPMRAGRGHSTVAVLSAEARRGLLVFRRVSVETAAKSTEASFAASFSAAHLPLGVECPASVGARASGKEHLCGPERVAA